jgi:hypothetical protein
MGKFVKKYLLVFLLAFAATEIVYAAATKFTNVEVTSNLTVDGTLSSNSCIVSTNPLSVTNLSVTDAVNASSATLSSSTMPLQFTGAITATGAPAKTGLLGMDSSFKLYASTSTNAGGWQKVSGQ